MHTYIWIEVNVILVNKDTAASRKVIKLTVEKDEFVTVVFVKTVDVAPFKNIKPSDNSVDDLYPGKVVVVTAVALNSSTVSTFALN